jgi:hypothetical protein
MMSADATAPRLCVARIATADRARTGVATVACRIVIAPRLVVAIAFVVCV